MSVTTMLDRHLEALSADPENVRAFTALQEHYFLAGQWPELVSVYRRRLEAPSVQRDPALLVPLLFRLAQVLEERCLEIDEAREIYWQVARLDPKHRPAMRQLRQIHMRREQWDMVLQIAEIEGQLAMAPFERGVFLAEMGSVWLKGLGDPGEALGCFQGSLETDPNQQQALEGLARALESFGRHEEAAQAWERLIQLRRGIDRAPCLVALGKLLAGPLQQPDRAAECFRRAITDDPNNLAAIEALVIDAAAREQWSLVGELYQRRFDCASGARRRSAIAIEAGHIHLQRLDDVETARAWFERALELCDDDVAVHHAVAELQRRTDDSVGLCRTLDRLIALGGRKTAVSTLLEAADLHSEAGADEQALAYLERAQTARPDDPLVLEALSDTLARIGLHADLAAVLERRAALAIDDSEAQAEALCELGCLYEEHLSDLDAAIVSLERAFEASPQIHGAAKRLEELYRKTERWNDLRSLLERARDRQGSPAQRGAYSCTLGELLLERLGDLAGAASCFEHALEIDPASTRAVHGLAAIAARSGDSSAMLRACEREAAVCSDPERLAELTATGIPLLEQSHRNEDALAWAQRLVEVRPQDPDALRTAARLQDSLGLQAELAGSLEALDRLLTGPEQAANRRRLAQLRDRAGDSERAMAAYEAALECDPDDLESLTALARHYEASRAFESLARVQRKRADLLSGTERARCLEQLSHLLESWLSDVDGAIVVLWRLCGLPEQPDDAASRLEALLERAGRFEELAQLLLERRRSLSDEDPEALALDLRRGRLLLDTLGQTEEAATLFRSIRKRRPDCREATEGLEQALRAGNDTAGLVLLLESRSRTESEPAARARIDLERGVLLEESLGEHEAAQQIWTALAAQQSDASVAAAAGLRLDRLLERSGAWSTLRERLENRIGCGSPDEDLDLHRRLAALCRDRLSDPESCIEHLEAVGRMSPGDVGAWQGLALLYLELGRNEDLLRVLECEIATGPDLHRELELRARAAGVCAGAASDAGSMLRARDHYERVLQLASDHSEASEFLIEHYEDEGRLEDVLRLLQRRLSCVSNPESESFVRLRISDLLADRLADPEAGLEALEPASELPGCLLLVAERLAELYERCGRDEALADLCRRASQASEEPAQRGVWNARLAAILRARGASREAAVACRAALRDRPGDRELEADLRDLYRELGESAPLAELLEAEIARLGPAEAAARRIELATLFADRLERPEDALQLSLAVLQIEPANGNALDLATRLSERLGRHEDMLGLLDARLAEESNRSSRAALLERRGDLLAVPLDRADEAAAAYREAISLDPRRARARESLCRLLECAGRWQALLDCLHLEYEVGEPDRRADVLERAVALSREHLSRDASLPWLERLRAERPEDPEILARIGDVHRQAGRPESLLRVLEAELRLTVDPGRKLELHAERARILERDLRSPARAIGAWEAAREIAPSDPEVLCALDRLYELTGRVRERTDVLQARLDTCDGEARISLHRNIAVLWATQLASSERAVPHLLHAVDLSRRQGSEEESVELLRLLAECLRSDGRVDAWARAAEAELASLPATSESDSRRAELHHELARAYADGLGLPDRAAAHLRALLAAAEAPEATASGAFAPESIERAEATLIGLLRRERNHLELAARLAKRLERFRADAEGWIELARLRAEQLQQPAAAADAFRSALEVRPESLAALHGLRHVSEYLRDWSEVARSLDLELQSTSETSTRERLALQRRLGDISWRRLGDRQRAIRAYRAALACAPEDLEVLRPLSQLLEQCGEWSEALDLHEREIDVLDPQEPTRRQALWLHVGEVARDTLSDPGRALRGYEAAAAISPLEPARVREWADLYGATGNTTRYVEVFADWCDDPAADARCSDHLALAECLEQLGRRGEALARACRASEVDAESAEAWQMQARLLEERGESAPARDALARAAALLPAAEGAALLLRAALLVADRDPDDAAELLRSALARDGGFAVAHARLARLAHRLGRHAESEAAAQRALDLAATAPLEPSLRLDAALAGGASAHTLAHLEQAARLYAQALEVEPDHREALDAQGEILHALGDVSGAARTLERRLALAGPNPGRGRQLAIIAIGLQYEGQAEAALAHFSEALDVEPGLDMAHAGIVELHEAADRRDLAIGCLERWLGHNSESGSRARSHLRLADHLQAAGRAEEAEQHLRRALADDASLESAWLRLAEQLHAAERWDATLEVCEQARDHLQSPAIRARLALVRGRILDRQDDRRAAAEAYGEAISADPLACEAALARARLLRGLGDWAAAAATLGDFAASHPEPGAAALARVHLERGRLMAGPLEDVAEAVVCYERALAIEPGLSEAREPMAALLAHLPERWADAVGHQLEILEEDPTRPASLRALLEISRRRDPGTCSRFGLGVLRALGIASPDETAEAPESLPVRIGGTPQLEDPLWETARRITNLASQEIGQALARVERRSADDAASEAVRAFWELLGEAQSELCAPGLCDLPSEDLSSTVYTVTALAADPGGNCNDGPYLYALDQALGRWARRKIRKSLGNHSVRQIQGIDYDAWRDELRVLAAAIAVDRCEGDLRTALVTLATDGGRREPHEISETANITAVVAGAPLARRLLRRAVQVWCGEIMRSA